MIGFDIVLTGIEKLPKKAINDAAKAAFLGVGIAWRRRYLPLHFGDGAQRRYGYARRAGQLFNGTPRKGSYQARKLREKGHERPLEYSGAGKRQALYADRDKARATRDQVRVPLPAVFNFNGKHVRMRDEITAIRPDEMAALATLWVDLFEGAIGRAGGQNGRASLTVDLGAKGPALFQRYRGRARQRSIPTAA